MGRDLTSNAKAWCQLAADSLLSENQIKGLAFLFSFINSHEKKAVGWMTNPSDYSIENKTMLLDRYEIDEITLLGSLALLNELSYKVGYDLKVDRVNSNSDYSYVIFISKDGKHLPEIDKENYNHSLSLAHNLYSVFLEKIGAVIQANSFIEGCELGMLYSSYLYEADPAGYKYFFENFYSGAPPIYKFLWNVDFMTTHSEAGSNPDKQYLPFQIALYHLLTPDVIGEYVWNAASVLFYRNQNLLCPEKQWLNPYEFLKESFLAVELYYEEVILLKEPNYFQNLQRSIEDKYIFQPINIDEDAFMSFFQKLLFDDYKYTLDEKSKVDPSVKTIMHRV